MNYPSMAIFFYICEYFGITAKEFFDTETASPTKVKKLLSATAHLGDENLDHLIAIAEAMK